MPTASLRRLYEPPSLNAPISVGRDEATAVSRAAALQDIDQGPTNFAATDQDIDQGPMSFAATDQDVDQGPTNFAATISGVLP
ncbi:MAG: hypothetical protein KDJ52_34145, partial [Anaerolineae bacterium]|nr:hypothetical protein [Anaerolineae bacterium]